MSIKIGTMKYVDSSLKAGEEVTLEVCFKRSSTNSYKSRYNAAIYLRHGKNGKDYYKASEKFKFDRNSKTEIVKFKFKVDEPGEIYTSINICDEDGDLLVSRMGKYPDTFKKETKMVKGNNWHIKIKLLNDRRRIGKLYFYVDGKKIRKSEDQSYYECLGHGYMNKFKKMPYYNDNYENGEIWQYECGHTPLGKWSGITDGPKTGYKNIRAYGSNKYIRLEAVKGDCVEACGRKKNGKYGRAGILIHGGRQYETKSLKATKGCVRVFDEDIKFITKYIDKFIKNKKGYVYIEEE